MDLQYISCPAEEFAEPIGAGMGELCLPRDPQFPHFFSARVQEWAGLEQLQVEAIGVEGCGAAADSCDTHKAELVVFGVGGGGDKDLVSRTS